MREHSATAVATFSDDPEYDEQRFEEQMNQEVIPGSE
jgi:hypothetical protein